MKEIEYLLTALTEECAEVSQEASKAIRYGILNSNPRTSIRNDAKLMSEYHDIVAVMELLQERGHMAPFQLNTAMINAKKEKLITEMQLHPGGTN